MENPTCIKCVCNGLGRWRLFCAGAPYVSSDIFLLCLLVINCKIIKNMRNCIKRFKMVKLEIVYMQRNRNGLRWRLFCAGAPYVSLDLSQSPTSFAASLQLHCFDSHWSALCILWVLCILCILCVLCTLHESM